MACRYSQRLLVRAWRVLCLALFGSVCHTGGLVRFFFSHSAELLNRGCATGKTKWDDLSLELLDPFSQFCHQCCDACVPLGGQGAETVSSHLRSQRHNHVLDKGKNTKFLHVFLVIFHNRPHQLLLTAHDKIIACAVVLMPQLVGLTLTFFHGSKPGSVSQHIWIPHQVCQSAIAR